MSAFANLTIIAGILAGLMLGLQVIAAADTTATAAGPTLTSPTSDQLAGATIQWAHGERGWRGGGHGWRGGGRWHGDWGHGLYWRDYDPDYWWRWHLHHPWVPYGDLDFYSPPYGAFGYGLR